MSKPITYRAYQGADEAVVTASEAVRNCAAREYGQNAWALVQFIRDHPEVDRAISTDPDAHDPFARFYTQLNEFLVTATHLRALMDEVEILWINSPSGRAIKQEAALQKLSEALERFAAMNPADAATCDA